MTFSRRTFLGVSMALAGSVMLPAMAFASNCGQTPASIDNLLKRLDGVAPDMMFSPARLKMEVALRDFSYIYMVAANGQPGEPAYKDRDDAARAVFLQDVFAKSTATLNSMKALRSEFAHAGLTGAPVDLLDMQIASFDGNYDERRAQMPKAIAMLNNPLVQQDDVLTAAAATLQLAIQTVGDGNADVAIARAWDASPHQDRLHFQRFLPVVSPSGEMVYRMAQLQKGAAFIRA